jgi:hypothetical protein
MGKIFICPDEDSNPRPFGLIVDIKTPNHILAFTAIRKKDELLNVNTNNFLDSIDFWKRTEYVMAVVNLTIWFFECRVDRFWVFLEFA